jgi:plastocyanin
MFRHGIEPRGASVLLALTAALTTAGLAGSAQAAGIERTITMVAIESKGGTTVDKEPFPSAPLPEGKGYELTPPDANRRWEVSTYRWQPNQIIVNQGDEVTLEILGVNGAEHPTAIEGYDVNFTVKRGELTTVKFTADKAGVFAFRCGIHQPSMVGELIVLPGS